MREEKTRKSGGWDEHGEFCFRHAKSLRCLLDIQCRQLDGENEFREKAGLEMRVGNR